MNKYVLVEVKFHSNKRKTLPITSYRPDIILEGSDDYHAISFIDLFVEKFDQNVFAKIQFTVQDELYDSIVPGTTFNIMEGPEKVGEGRFLKVEELKPFNLSTLF